MEFERKQFTFYRSFYDAAVKLPVKKQKDYIWEVVRLALFGTEPETKDQTILAMLEIVKPLLEKARSRAMARLSTDSEDPAKYDFVETSGNDKIDFVETSGNNKKIRGRDRIRKKNKSKGEGEEVDPPTGENKETFSGVFDALLRNGVFMADKDKTDCEALCAEYGTRAVTEAIERAIEQNAPRWSYVRAIVTSGGVRGGHSGGRGGFIRHGDGMSPMMQQAVDRMLAEDDDQ